MKTLIIRESYPDDLKSVLEVERAAFGSDEEANLVSDLLEDPSAEPRLSLLAFNDDRPVGHILFTNAVLDPMQPVLISILGPLAVIPEAQRQGVGGMLIQEGFNRMLAADIEWIFVLGHSSYYPRFGFSPAMQLGFEPPFPILGEFSNPWMAINLIPSKAEPCHGTVIPSDAFNHPQYWGE